MKITFSSYSGVNTKVRESIIMFDKRNHFTLRPIYDSNSTVELNWYTLYNFETLTYKKYRVTDNTLFDTGKMRIGNFKVDGFNKTYRLLNYEDFSNKTVAKLEENVTGAVTNTNEIYLINNELLSPFIDERYIKHLPIGFKGELETPLNQFGILAKRNWIYNGVSYCRYKIDIEQ